MIVHLLVALVVLLAAAKLGGHAAERLGQPAVLGELLAGILVGALPLVGLTQLDFIKTDHVVEALAELGVIILLFEVGLSTRLADLMKVGLSAFLVACIGVIVPMGLGWGVGVLLLPEASPIAHLFLGAALSATSVGITARVLRDLGVLASTEGQIILGAAVIDDVLGLLVLAVMAGLAGAGAAASGSTGAAAAIVTVKAVVFLVGSLVVGRALAPRFFRAASHLRGKGVIFTLALVTCFASLGRGRRGPGYWALAWLRAGGVPFGELLGAGRRSDHLTPVATFWSPSSSCGWGCASISPPSSAAR
jgi:Kef-type K+ transport system membrane component KefB